MQKRKRRSSVIIAVNPRSGTGQRLGLVHALRERLEAKGFRCHIERELSAIVSATEEALRRDDLQTVVSAGGDGTIGLLVNHLPAAVPFSILPLGTENLLAKHLGIRQDVDDIAQVVDQGRVLELDAGRANGRLFLIMAGCGFDADVVRRLHGQRRGNIRHWSYLRPLWETITRYRYPALRIVVDDRPLQTHPSWAFVFNVPRYAMNLPIAPEADPSDGLLDVCTYQKGSLWHGILYIATIILRRQRKQRDITHHRARSLRIEADQEVPYQLDGDPGGNLPLQIEVVPRRLRILMSG